MDALAFYSSGLLAVLAALLVVTRRNPIYSAILLVLFFVCISVQFLVLRAPFLAVVQVFIYAGAIMVLFVFVIMLLNLTPQELLENVSTSRKVLSAALATGLFLFLSAVIRSSPTVQTEPHADLLGSVIEGEAAHAGEIAPMGRSLFTTHLLAFELSSVLILVAMIGAVYLNKKRGDPRDVAPPEASGGAVGASGREGPGSFDARSQA
jgi:NADH-quinone oxidoreductase subunit J